jgi:hypothetical protein
MFTALTGSDQPAFVLVMGPAFASSRFQVGRRVIEGPFAVAFYSN